MPATVTDRLNGLTTSVAVKPPCAAVTSANIDLAGLQTIGGVVLAEGDRVLVQAQTNPVHNGIYNASTSSWVRAKDFDGARDVIRGTLVLVRTGSVDGAIYEVTTANPIVIGTSAITFDLRDDPAATYPQTAAEIAAGVTPANYSYEPGDVRRYGLTNAGLQAAINQAQSGGLQPLVPFGVSISSVTGVEISGDEITLTNNGVLTAASSAVGTMILVSGDDCIVQGTGIIDTNSCDYGIRMTGDRCTAYGMRYKGHVDLSYIKGEGDYNTADSFIIMPGYNCSNIPVRMAGAHLAPILQPVVRNGRFLDVRGFNVQFAFCKDFLCAYNTFANPTYADDKIAVGAQSVFTNVNLTSTSIDRWGANVNGVQVAISTGSPPLHTGGGLYTITLNAAASNGQTVTFYGSRSLENLQANSEADGGIFEGNVCDGTGDSNCVVGADYHDGVNTGGVGVDVDDFPRNIIVRNNTFRNAFASAVNMSQVVGGQVGGNDCSSWGLRHDSNGGPFNCAIFAGAASSIRVDPNTLHGDTTRTQYGVGGWESSGNTTAIDFRKSHTPLKRFAKQNFVGTFTAKYFCAISSVSAERRYDVDIDEGTLISYPSLQTLFDAAQSVAGLPDSNDYWLNEVASGTTPVTRDTSVKQGGTASARVGAGKTFQARVLAKELLGYSAVYVSVWMKNGGATAGALQVFYDNGENDSEPRLTMTAMSTDWERYEIAIPMSGIGTTGIALRFAAGATHDTYFQYPDISRRGLSIL